MSNAHTIYSNSAPVFNPTPAHAHTFVSSSNPNFASIPIPARSTAQYFNFAPTCAAASTPNLAPTHASIPISAPNPAISPNVAPDPTLKLFTGNMISVTYTTPYTTVRSGQLRF